MMTQQEIDDVLKAKMPLIERETWRSWNKFPRTQGVIGWEDVKQQALRTFMYCIEKAQQPGWDMSYFDAYLVQNIKLELINYANSIRRQFDVKFDVPEQIDEVPDVLQDKLPDFDSVEVVTPLCKESREFLNCLLNPPAELKALIDVKAMSGKPHCKNILPDMLKWLGFDYDTYVLVRQDIQHKCVLHI